LNQFSFSTSNMSNLLNPESPSSKCFISTGTLPRFIDPKQPPTKKKPFSTIMNQPFNHTVSSLCQNGKSLPQYP